MKNTLLKLWSVDSHIRSGISFGRWTAYKLPLIGRAISMMIDRILLILYGIDLCSRTIFVKKISIPHPVGVLLGGNGIRSEGRVVINAGVKLVGHSPRNPHYLEKHAKMSVFELGDNVVIGCNSIIVGPVRICSDVVVATLSMVNSDIIEPGLYAGSPAKKISDKVSQDWVEQL